jgi:membrane protease YdiL (CAAX protease family)
MFLKEKNHKKYFLKLMIWYLLTLGGYLLYKFLLMRAIHLGMFSELSSVWFYIMDMVLSLIFGLFLIYFFRPKINFSLKNRKYILVLVLFFIALLFRFFENPTGNIELVKNLRKFALFSTEYHSAYDLTFIFITLVIVGPFVEELFYRKLLLNSLSNKTLAVIVSSILFAFLHLANKFGINIFISTFLFGVISCLIYYKSGFFYSFIFHASYNFLFFIIAYLISQ